MQSSRFAPLAMNLSRSARAPLAQGMRYLAQARNLHVQAPAATYMVGSKRLRQNAGVQSNWYRQQIRTYADKVVKVPQMAESISEGTLKQWVKQVGDFVAQDEEVATIETDKIDVTVNSPASGTIVEVYAQEEDNVAVGADFFKLELGDAPKEGAAAPAKKEQKKEEESKPAEEPKKEEPKKQESSAPAPTPAPSQPKKEAPAAPAADESDKKVYGNRNERRVKMNRMRLRIAERLKESQDTAASLTTFNEIDMSNLMNLRKLYKDAIVKKHGVKFGFMSAFVKASAAALEELPAVNASIDGNEIVYHDFIDMSVAVATPKGLVTPVLRNVEDMNFIDIEKNIAALGQKARDNKITIEDMAGGTFTISNGGVFGSLMGTPILNTPQSAILGMHAIKERPVVVDGKIEIRPMMYVALTYDHRIIDGREAVTFLVRIKEMIEDPRRLLLEI
ncbi:dihydrolipoyllysine-residue succinyltransferase E2 component [Radiomyces spectabilis]|uniref:dihydrolipoyllysine-residue succinyltransferase E2 component n=1 Tax=Radiomyces spectabilis TaxID=64574 RepID=UPI00221EDCB6|nr:dihydrolipoyllysine-residue succinyltransferase E2 component [Radiomyces spectabilis]KAI8390933.1 dihydrolipoyllysine-residue succinyltransferase E2 component [Radiomyces spectabilis]